jgi:hypothetical protein
MTNHIEVGHGNVTPVVVLSKNPRIVVELLERGRQWKVTVFYVFYVIRRVRIFNTKISI